jgi:uncharacterized protein (DUF302 family)
MPRELRSRACVSDRNVIPAFTGRITISIDTFTRRTNAMTTDIGIRRTVDLPYEQAVEQTTAALKAEGFGVLTRIDIQATLKEKLNVDFRRYVILGACNPALAHRALSANLDVGLLLPCNVTVYEEGDGSVVTAVDPLEMLGSLTADPVAHAVAVEAGTKLRRVIELIAR